MMQDQAAPSDLDGREVAAGYVFIEECPAQPRGFHGLIDPIGKLTWRNRRFRHENVLQAVAQVQGCLLLTVASKLLCAKTGSPQTMQFYAVISFFITLARSAPKIVLS